MSIKVVSKPEEAESLQTRIIRQIQIDDGQVPCYATSASDQCNKKECSWRHDCFEEAGERG